MENLSTFVRTLGNQFIRGKKVFIDPLRLDNALIDGTGTAGTSGQVLSTTSTSTQWITVGTSNVAALDDLTDVQTGTPSNAQLLRYDSEGEIWYNWTPNFLDVNDGLNDLNGVILTSPVSNQFLKYNGSNWVNANVFLSQLGDTSITSPSADQILVYGQPLGEGPGVNVWYNKTHNFLTTSTALDDLSNVIISLQTSGDILRYNGTNWVNVPFSNLENDTLDSVTDRGSTTTNSINVGGVTTDYVQFDTAVTLDGNESQGYMAWNSDVDTVSVYPYDSQWFNIGQDMHWHVKNGTPNTIERGQVLMATGAVGNSGKIEAGLMVADGTVDAKYIIGVAIRDIGSGEFGKASTQGIIRGINTSTFEEGSVLWCDPDNAGGLTATEPTAPDLRLPIAFVVSSDNNGAIAVRIVQGNQLHELHDVRVVSPANTDILRYSTVTNRWENWTPNYISGYIETDTLDSVTDRGATTTNTITIGGALISATAPLLDFVDTNSFTDVNDRFRIRAVGDAGRIQWYDSSASSTLDLMHFSLDGKVGIGTTSPVAKLQVASETNAVDVLRISNTAGDSGSVQGITHLAINHFGAGTFPSTRITAYQDGVSGWPGGMYFSTRSINTDSAPVERMRITSAGNVGIGTTSPAEKLDVAGAIALNGYSAIYSPNSGNDIYANIRVIRNLHESDGMYIGYGNAGTTNGHLRFYANGTNERMRIDASNGNVGIGTTSPGAKLHVYSSSSGASAYALNGVEIESNGVTGINILSPNTGYGRIYFGAPVSNTAGAIEYIHNATLTSGYMKLRAGGADSVFILGNGNVGIGTTSPSRQLHVKSSTFGAMLISGVANDAFSEYDDGTNVWKAGIDYSQSAYRITHTNFNGSGISLDSSGNLTVDGNITTINNIGVGTTSPSTNIQTGSASAGIDTSIRAYHSDGAYTEIRGYGLLTNRTTAYIRPTADKNAIMSIGNDNNTWNYLAVNANYFTVSTDTTEHLRVTNTGNVGIGTNSPTQKLDVNGQGAFLKNYIYGQSNYHIALNEDSGTGYIGNINGSPYISNSSYYGSQIYNVTPTQTGIASVYTQSTGDIILLTSTFTAGAATTQQANTRVIIKGNGNVGIGTTSPSEKLHVVGNGLFTGGIYVNNTSAYLWNTTNGVIRFGTNNTERARIDSSGNVGIGTTSPAVKLQVNDGLLLGDTYVQPSGSAWTTSNSQLILGGSHNSGFNTGTKVKLLISGYDNDGSTIYPILLEDENGYDDFWIKNRPSGSGLPTMYFAGNVGIGTTSPAYKLEVSGGAISIKGNAAGNSLRFDDSGGTSRNAMYVDTSNYLSVGNANYTGIKLYHTATEPSTNALTGSKIVEAFGTTDNLKVLAEPAAWLAVRVGTTDYAIPMYIAG